MRLFGFDRYGGPEVQGQFDGPAPGPDHLVVRLLAAAINPADIKVRDGLRQGRIPVNFPMAMGREAAGIVAHDPLGVHPPGTVLFGGCAAGWGAVGEMVALDPDQSAVVPAGVDPADAACLPVAAGTAWDALSDMELPPGSSVLVLGGGGGVGTYAIQLARLLGLRPIAVASESKAALIAELGGHHVPAGPGWVDKVRELVPDAVSGVVDAVGGSTLQEALPIVSDPRGIRSAASPGLAEQLGGAGVTRRRTGEVFTELAQFIQAGTLRTVIGGTHPFESAAEAVAQVESGHARGKVIVLGPSSGPAAQ